MFIARQSRSLGSSTRSMLAISQRTLRRESSSTCPPGRGTSTSRSTASPRSDQGGTHVFGVFEVLPNKEKREDYLGNAKMLRPELEQVDGFIDNIRYKSLTRDGWILSLSGWRGREGASPLAHPNAPPRCTAE